MEVPQHHATTLQGSDSAHHTLLRDDYQVSAMLLWMPDANTCITIVLDKQQHLSSIPDANTIFSVRHQSTSWRGPKNFSQHFEAVDAMSHFFTKIAAVTMVTYYKMCTPHYLTDFVQN